MPVTPPAGWEPVFVGDGLQMVSEVPPHPPAPLPDVDDADRASGRAPRAHRFGRPRDDRPHRAHRARPVPTTHDRARRLRRHLPRHRARGDGRPAHAASRLLRDQRRVHASRRPPTRLRLDRHGARRRRNRRIAAKRRSSIWRRATWPRSPPTSASDSRSARPCRTAPTASPADISGPSRRSATASGRSPVIKLTK